MQRPRSRSASGLPGSGTDRLPNTQGCRVPQIGAKLVARPLR